MLKWKPESRSTITTPRPVLPAYHTNDQGVAGLGDAKSLCALPRNARVARNSGEGGGANAEAAGSSGIKKKNLKSSPRLAGPIHRDAFEMSRVRSERVPDA